MKLIPTLLCFFLFATNSLRVWGEELFIQRSAGQLYRGSESVPYRFKGVTFRYAPLLTGVKPEAGQQELCAQLDTLRAAGITNLRVLAAAAEGVIPDSAEGNRLLRGLDFLLKEMRSRELVAVISFPVPGDSAWLDPANAAADSLQNLYLTWLKRVVTHVNSHTGKAYRDDPVIMAWQMGEAVRPTSTAGGGDALFAWVRSTANFIRRLDSRHLITVGTEGIRGCGNDAQLYRRLHTLPQIDYLTLQFRPIAWRWATKSSVFSALSRVYNQSADYLAAHERIAFLLRKPLVIESVTYPHDVGFAQSASGTRARDAYFAYVLSWLTANRQPDSALCGVRVGHWDAGSSLPAEEGQEAEEGQAAEAAADEAIRSTDRSTLQTLRRVTW